MFNESTLATWKAVVRSNIARKVAELKKDGTVGMSFDNLFMVVSLPQHGGPATPAAARTIFAELIRESSPNVRKFIIA